MAFRIDRKTEQQVIDLYRSSDLGGRLLARRLGISQATVYRSLRRNGIAINDAKRNGRLAHRFALTDEQARQVVADYEAGARSIALGKKYGVSRESILSALKRQGFEITAGRPKRTAAPTVISEALALAKVLVNN